MNDEGIALLFGVLLGILCGAPLWYQLGSYSVEKVAVKLGYASYVEGRFYWRVS